MSTSSPAPVGRGLHRVKRALLTPQRLARRYRHRNDGPDVIALLEHFEYRSTIDRFMRDVAARPELLHEIDPRTDLVLDIGGFVGEWCVPVSSRTTAPIHVYEPSIWARRRLLQAVEGHDHIHVHTFGLGASTTTATLARVGPGSTTYDLDGDWDRAEIEIRDAAEVFATLTFERAAMKLNIEGGEYDVLERLLDAGEMPRIGDLFVQFHEWLPHAHRRRRAIRRRLSDTHRPAWEYPWIWEKWVPA